MSTCRLPRSTRRGSGAPGGVWAISRLTIVEFAAGCFEFVLIIVELVIPVIDGGIPADILGVPKAINHGSVDGGIFTPPHGVLKVEHHLLQMDQVL